MVLLDGWLRKGRAFSKKGPKSHVNPVVKQV